VSVRNQANRVFFVAIQANAGFLGKGNARFGQKVRAGAAAAVLSAFLAACATSGGVTVESPTDVKVAAVTARAKARWQAVIEGNAEGAYGFLSPGSKAVTSFERFRARARLTGFRSAELESVECETEVCKVKFRVILDHRVMSGLSVPVEETWVLENGQYWYVWRL
jgi:hypothetical protein